MRLPRALRFCAFLTALVWVWPIAAQQEGDKPKPPVFFFQHPGGALAQPENRPAQREQRPEAALPPTAAAFDFEAESQVGYWRPTDAEAAVQLATEAGAAHGGKGCLRVTYNAREGVFEQVAARPLQVVGGKTLTFWVRTSQPTQLSLGVVEQGGGFYQQFCVTPADAWAKVDVPLASLILSQDTNDPDGRLDVADIVETRVADLANLPGGLADALGRKAGEQQLLLDDVAITDDDPDWPGAAPPQGVLADGFERDTIYALAIGGAELRRGEGSQGAGLAINCRRPGPRWMGIVMGVGYLPLTDRNEVSCQLTASRPVTVSLVLEERDGSKYSRRLKIDPADGWSEHTVPFDQLLLETDSQDENGVLDRDQIRVLILVADTAGLLNVDPLTVGLDEVIFR